MTKYGIWGCGVHAYQHASAAAKIPGLELVAVCDVNNQNLDKFCASLEHSVLRYNNETDFLASGIEAVVITTPDQFHLQNLRKAINARLHVLIEKPIVINEEGISEFEDLLAESAKQNLVITSCHPRRFDPPFVWLKSNLQKYVDRFGPAINFSFDFSHQKPVSARKRFESLMEHHVSHEIDAVDFLFGRKGFTATTNIDDPVRFEVDGHRQDGTSFHFSGTMMLGGPADQQSFERIFVRFERGDISMDTRRGIARIMDHETAEETTEKCGTKNYPVRFMGVMNNFSESIAGVSENYLSHQDLMVSAQTGVLLHKNKTITLD